MKILVLAPIVPFPLYDGDRMRLYHLLQGLSRGNTVSLLACTRDPQGARHALALKDFVADCEIIFLPTWKIYWNCLRHLFSWVPFNVCAYASNAFAKILSRKLEQGAYDLIYAYRLRMAPYVLFKKQKKILDLTDAMTIYTQRLAKQPFSFLKKMYLRWEWFKLSRWEPSICNAFDACLISSQEELSFLQSQGVANLHWIANGVSIANFQTKSRQRKKDTLLFTGNMGYYPNQQGMLFFKEKIWPLIKKEMPQVKLQIVGGHVPAWMRQWIKTFGFDIPGQVAEMRPYLQQATLFVCPLQVGSGIRFKILEAMAAGLPVVSTTLGCEGLKVEHKKSMMIADDEETFAKSTVELLHSSTSRKKIADKALEICKRNYDWSLIEGRLKKVLKNIHRKEGQN